MFAKEAIVCSNRVPLSVVFDPSPFVRSHGRDPGGRGTWAFAEQPRSDAADVLWAPPMSTLTQAKTHARRTLRAAGRTGHVTLYVLP